MVNKIEHLQREPDNAGPASNPYFSVIITAYNRANLISRALNSLNSQTEKDFEAIIVDDGSTDDTYLTILPYLKSNRRITYIRQVHRGIAAAKNTGLWSATGRYVTFLDSDDEFNSSHLESRKRILMQNPLVKFVYGGTKILGNQYVPDRFDFTKKVNLNDCIIGGTFFIERSTAIALNGFRNIQLGEDVDLFDRAKKEHINMMEVDRQTYVYHHETTDSVTNQLSARL